MQVPAKYAAAAALILLVAFVCASPARAQGGALEQARIAAANRDYTEAARYFDEALKEKPDDENILLEAGNVNMELERYATARALYERAYSEDSRNPEVNTQLGLALSQLGRHPEAIEKLQRGIKYSDNSMKSRLALARGYIQVGPDSLSRAELTVLGIAKEFPDKAEPYVVLGDLYFAQNFPLLSKPQYEKAIERDASLIEPRVKLGRTYRQLAIASQTLEEANEYYNKALEQFNEATRLDPKNAGAWIGQAEILVLAKRWEQAGQSLERYGALRPEDVKVDTLLATAAYKGKFYTVAIGPLERVVSRNDSVTKTFGPKAHGWLGKGYYAKAQQYSAESKNDSAQWAYARATEEFAKAPKTDIEKDDQVLYGYSILQAGGDTTKAIGIYRAIIDEFPEDCELAMKVGNLFYQMKRYDDVIYVFEKRIANCPNQPAATPYLFVGLSHFASKRAEEAMAALEKSVAADSTIENLQGYYWLMNVYAQSGALDKSAKVAGKMEALGVAETKPEWMAKGYYFMGAAKLDAKDYKGAAQEFERSIKLNPKDAQSYLFAAFSYQYQSDKDNACRNYRQALKLDPNNETAKKNMKQLGC